MERSNDEILVSVFVITYNHEKFIAKAIDSALMQKCDFNFEIVIGEDCSTDRTKEIVINYQKKYPDIIKPIFNTINIGPSENAKNVLKACEGDYIAMLEGDDYWTDPFKLQKQVDFLESNREYSLCCHRYYIRDTNSEKTYYDYNFKLFENNPEGIIIDIGMYFKYWLIKTLTVLFRSKCLDFELLRRYKHFKDVQLHYHTLVKGKGYCMNFFGGIYNMHPGGIWSDIGALDQAYQALISIYELAEQNRDDKILQDNCAKQIRRYLLSIAENDKKFLIGKESISFFFSYLRITKSVKGTFKLIKALISLVFKRTKPESKRNIFTLEEVNINYES